jgi:hypothetical protein
VEILPTTGFAECDVVDLRIQLLVANGAFPIDLFAVLLEASLEEL